MPNSIIICQSTDWVRFNLILLFWKGFASWKRDLNINFELGFGVEFGDYPRKRQEEEIHMSVSYYKRAGPSSFKANFPIYAMQTSNKFFPSIHYKFHSLSEAFFFPFLHRRENKWKINNNHTIERKMNKSKWAFSPISQSSFNLVHWIRIESTFFDK